METTHAQQLTRDVFERGFGLGDMSTVDAALDPSAVDRHAFAPDEPDMAHHLKGAIQMFRGAFPDLTVTVGHLIQQDKLVAVRVEMSGHHTGTPILGIPSAGAAVHIEQFHIIEVNGEGKGLRHWANVGIEALHTQLTNAANARSA